MNTCEYSKEDKKCYNTREFVIAFVNSSESNVSIVYYCEYHKMMFLKDLEYKDGCDYKCRHLESNDDENNVNINNGLIQLYNEVLDIQRERMQITSNVLIHNLVYIAQTQEGIDFGYDFELGQNGVISRQLQADLKEEDQIRNHYIEKPNQKITDFLNKIKSDIDAVRPKMISKILYLKQYYCPDKTYDECIKEQLNRVFPIPHCILIDTIKSMVKLGYIQHISDEMIE